MSIRAGFCIAQVPAPSAAPHGLDPAIPAGGLAPGIQGLLPANMQQQHPQMESSRLWAPVGRDLAPSRSTTVGKSFL